MATVNPAERIMEHGKVLVRAIEALETIDHTGPMSALSSGSSWRHTGTGCGRLSCRPPLG
jgi:hypothetical protein